MSDTSALLHFAREGARVRRAEGSLEALAPLLVGALRRGMPFLGAQGASITPSYSRAVSVDELAAELARPFYTVGLDVLPGGGRGAVVFDAGCLSLMLDGVLGGDARAAPTLNPSGLTGAQTALVARVTDGVVTALSAALSKKIGMGLRPRPADGEDAMTQGAPIACCLELTAATVSGRLTLLLPKESILADAPERALPQRTADPRLPGLMNDVELELVAELARVKLPVRRILSLKVGDTLRLDVPVEGQVDVRVGEQVLVRGQPTTRTGQLAVRVSGTGLEGPR